MKAFFGIIVILVLIGVGMGMQNVVESKKSKGDINTFEECVEAGNPILESYPEQCITKDGRTFIHDIGNELDKLDLIRIQNPRPGTTISSPLIITGEARGYWFFEANFPVLLINSSGMILAEGFATTKDDWMTEEFIFFEAQLEFEDINGTKSGRLFLKNANVSGLPENEDALEIPIKF